MRTIIQLTLISLLAAVAAVARGADVQPVRYDHYNPIVLNEHAIEKASAGDVGTARILLERAAQLAPHDERIRRNLATLRDWQAGKATPVPAQQQVPVGSATTEVQGIPDLPPVPLWQRK